MVSLATCKNISENPAVPTSIHTAVSAKCWCVYVLYTDIQHVSSVFLLIEDHLGLVSNLAPTMTHFVDKATSNNGCSRSLAQWLITS